MTEVLQELYPEIELHASGHLDVGQGHSLYWEECGNPAGIPVVFLHGGPGGSIWPRHRRFFNPEIYRIILFDQRGCGKSTPFAETNHNTTAHTLDDMEMLRAHLNISHWVLFGYSWGSTLAMAYAVAHPDAVSGAVIGGVFMGRPVEIRDFLLPDGLGATMFPDAYRDFLAPLTPEERKTPFQAYIKIFHSPAPDDVKRRNECVRQWVTWETVLMVMSYPLPPEKQDELEEDIQNGLALSIALLETHYIGQNCFIDASSLLDELGSLAHIPCHILQGRVDAVCPVQTAWDVHLQWPNSQLEIIPFGSHWTRQDEITDAIVRTCDTMASRLR